jgi:hypothetical protein
MNLKLSIWVETTVHIVLTLPLDGYEWSGSLCDRWTPKHVSSVATE